jgi:hypothetical protein
MVSTVNGTENSINTIPLRRPPSSPRRASSNRLGGTVAYDTGNGRTHSLVLLPLRPQDPSLDGNLLKLRLDKLEEVVESLRTRVWLRDSTDNVPWWTSESSSRLLLLSVGRVNESVERVTGSTSRCRGRRGRDPSAGRSSPSPQCTRSSRESRAWLKGDGTKRAMVVRSHCRSRALFSGRGWRVEGVFCSALESASALC